MEKPRLVRGLLARGSTAAMNVSGGVCATAGILVWVPQSSESN